MQNDATTEVETMGMGKYYGANWIIDFHEDWELNKRAPWKKKKKKKYNKPITRWLKDGTKLWLYLSGINSIAFSIKFR